ncbi:MAG: peptidoglycan-binding protein [Planctomycetota bacterium]|jgi:protein-glutamine gamma-glutamyltransferase
MTSIGSTPSSTPFDSTPPATDGAAAVSSSLSPALAGNTELAAIASGQGSIGLNSRGPAVRMVQELLLTHTQDPDALGSAGADAWWGQASMTALKAFQATAGLPETGVVDGPTLLALDDAVNADTAVSTGDTGGAVSTDPAPSAETAESLMIQTLADAAADGVLGAQELIDAEASIAARYGQDVAETVLLESFGVHKGELAYDAVDFLQGRVGGMAGHIGRYQELLGETLVGAKILDLDQDGVLDPEDLLFTEGADGTVDVKQIGTALRDDLKIQKCMVEACEAMDAAGHEFALIKDHYANEDFFTMERGGVFKLKPGTNPSDAIDDIFANPDEYGFECATAMVIVYYKAMKDMIGDKDFDAIMGDLKIGPWVNERDLDSIQSVSGSGQTESDGTHKPKPGEYRYIRNWDVSKKGKAAGWQGENVIYMGNGKYYGHPFGEASADAIVSHLNGHRKKFGFWQRVGNFFGADNKKPREASFTETSGFGRPSVFRFDRTPE